MKHILNQLIQLQELSFALSEQKASNPEARLTQLEESIAKLFEKLPEDIGSRYQRMHQRVPLVVVPIAHNNTCAGCGLAVPVALVNEVRKSEQIHACPHCDRFLYYQEGQPRRPEKKPGVRSELPTGIARFSDEALMLPKLAASNREDAVRELAELMAAQGFIEDGKNLVELAMRRESMISTAVESGLAFPHVRNVEGGSLTFALGLKPGGLKFDAPDGELTKIIFFIVIPTAASAFYLRLLAGLVGTFRTAKARNALLKSGTPEKMWQTLTALTNEAMP
jgi:mannitol/fructose-specific phosphotransferase system IIA component (Ntr-type)